MFDSVGWLEIVIIIIAGLFILGPERLPSAAAWLGRTVRQVREYAAGAREQLKREMGPEFEDYRKPLQELKELRNFNPRQAIVKHLWDDLPGESSHNGFPSNNYLTTQRPLAQGERPPYDREAT
jgi:sec-independent protein translocase protein TatB